MEKKEIKQKVEYKTGDEQYVKIMISETGEKGSGVPGDMRMSVNNMTERQLMLCAIALMERVFKGFHEEDCSVLSYIQKVLKKSAIIDKVAEELVNKEEGDEPNE